MPSGICPDCQKPVPYAIAQRHPVQDNLSFQQWQSLAYLCPFCRAVLSTTVEPRLPLGNIMARMSELRGFKE